MRCCIGPFAICLLGCIRILDSSAIAQDGGSGFYTDPATGIVYRRNVRTVERPVTETVMTKQEQTVYTPETVVSSTPEVRRTLTPVVEYRWQPKMEGRWNPFREPRVAYHHVPEMRWQARDEVVNKTDTYVQWKAEKKITEVPQRLTRIAREQKVDFEPVGRVAPQTAVASTSNIDPQIAARLRPMSAGENVTPMRSTAVYPGAPMVATGTGDTLRSSLNTGMRPTDLVPNTSGVYGTPPGSTTGVAGLPIMSIWR